MPSLTLFAAALVTLVITGRLLIYVLTRAADAFNISKFSVAFVLLALATSLPELSVGISSARQDLGGLVIAVALGSNVVNATLVIGIAAFLSIGISTATLKINRDVSIIFAATALLLLFLIDGAITSLEGYLLLALFAWYMTILYRESRNAYDPLKLPHVGHGVVAIIAAIALVVTLIIAADQTVDQAVQIAAALGIPAAIIGIMVVALGTSLPELTTAIHAARAKQPGLTLGTIIGSNIANTTLIVGTASIVQPLRVADPAPIVATAIFTLIATGALGYLALSNRNLTAREGLALIGIFLLYGLATILTGLASS